MKRLALVLTVSWTTWSSCMDMQTASLGNELPNERAATDAGNSTFERDAAVAGPDVDRAPPRLDAAQDQDGNGRADANEPVDSAEDTGTTDAGASSDGAVPGADSDAAPSQTASDASAPDSGRVRAESDDGGGRDAGRDAARPVNPICITEPWHCM